MYLREDKSKIFISLKPFNHLSVEQRQNGQFWKYAQTDVMTTLVHMRFLKEPV